MIHTILDELKQKVLDLKFIERYGGVVVPIEQVVTDEDGREKRIVFPASCDGQGKACYAANDYFELAPNDQYRSVSYWELRGDAVPFVPRRGNRGAWYGFRQSVRLVVWLNLQILGEEDSCNKLSDYLSVLAMNELSGQHNIGMDYVDGVLVKVERKVRKSMDIFGAYSYSDKNELLLYPYDFFAIDFTVEWYVKRNCVPDEIPYQQLHCTPISYPGGGGWNPDHGLPPCNCNWIDIQGRPHALSQFENDEGFITASDLPEEVCSVQSYPTFAEFPNEPESCVLYIDESTKKQYIESGGAYLEVGSSENIYNTDGALTGSRTVDQDGNGLRFEARTGVFSVQGVAGGSGELQTLLSVSAFNSTWYFYNAVSGKFVQLRIGNAGVDLETGQDLFTVIANGPAFLKLMNASGTVEYHPITSDDIDDSTSVKKFVTQGEKDQIGKPIPEYANDGAADADANLASGAPYSITGDRTVYRKP